jgi:hypothetical protein
VKPQLATIVVAVVAVVALASGCRAPGEPPSHPTRGEYQDLIRREVDAAGSALSTCVLVLRYVGQDRVPAPYTRVVLRQAANDLRKVSQDLSQITPPPGAARAHASFLAITLRDRNRLDHLATQSDDISARHAVSAALSADAATLRDHLTQQLDPA